MILDVDVEFLQPLVAEISWTKNIVIIEKCKETLERALVNNMKVFVEELGENFAFIG